MAKKLLVNEKTGEIIEAEEVVPFASITDLKKSEYHDGEDYEEGTSVTSLEGYEPLESIIARCMRTMQSPDGVVYQVLDRDALKAEETQQGIYEASGAKTLDEAFDTMDPTESQGFDLADASILQNKVAEGLSNLDKSDGASSNLSTKGANEAPSYSEVSDVVGKSESPATTDFPEKESNISENGK